MYLKQIPQGMIKIAAFLFLTVLLILSCGEAPSVNSENTPEPVDMVYPLLDASNSRWFFFNSATRPFGMVNLSPDNLLGGAWGSGYRYDTTFIRCFSHIHGWQLSGLPVLPTTGECRPMEGPDVYGSSFDHATEVVKPGYHKVVLDKYDITAELTSTTRVGFHRYTFPESDESHVLLDLSITLGPSDTQGGMVRKVNNRELEGYATMAPTRRRPQPITIYFVIQFDKDFQTLQGWQDEKIIEIQDSIKGDNIGVYTSFPTQNQEQRLMKLAISYTGISQARLNLKTELDHWDFEKTVRNSREEWNGYLKKIEIKGGTQKQQSRFYTDLWHALQGRRIVSDVNGMYIDNTGSKPIIRQIPLDENGQPRFNHYNSDSFWGAQWTLNTLWQLVYPKIAEEFVQSMLLLYKDGGLIPRGPSGGNYTYVMTGASSTPFIVAAYMKGIRGFDTETAYEGMRKNHFPGGLMSKAGYEHKTLIGGGVEYYLERGYIPYPIGNKVYGSHQDGAGQTLEYAYQDWTLAQMAKALGKEEDYTLFLARAKNYKNLYDPSTGWMRPREPDGSWVEPFDSMLHDHGWVEANAVQSTWFVPHDVEGLIQLMDGRDRFNQKLNRSFELARPHKFKSSVHGDRQGVSGDSIPPGGKDDGLADYINYGNQPSMQTAFLFNYSGAPWLTQYWGREVIDSLYSDLTPKNGYSGDEDQGLMGALAVLMKIGIFSMRGGADLQPTYELGSPIFDEIIIHLDQDFYPGDSILIQTINNNSKNKYIQSATLNGMPLEKPWIFHEEAVKNAVLVFKMGPEPNKKWGSSPTSAPPSMSKEIENEKY
jgi:predicted alpha-1,2-mannosidase